MESKEEIIPNQIYEKSTNVITIIPSTVQSGSKVENLTDYFDSYFLEAILKENFRIGQFNTYSLDSIYDVIERVKSILDSCVFFQYRNYILQISSYPIVLAYEPSQTKVSHEGGADIEDNFLQCIQNYKVNDKSTIILNVFDHGNLDSLGSGVEIYYKRLFKAIDNLAPYQFILNFDACHSGIAAEYIKIANISKSLKIDPSIMRNIVSIIIDFFYMGLLDKTIQAFELFSKLDRRCSSVLIDSETCETASKLLYLSDSKSIKEFKSLIDYEKIKDKPQAFDEIINVRKAFPEINAKVLENAEALNIKRFDDILYAIKLLDYIELDSLEIATILLNVSKHINREIRNQNSTTNSIIFYPSLYCSQKETIDAFNKIVENNRLDELINVCNESRIIYKDYPLSHSTKITVLCSSLPNISSSCYSPVKIQQSKICAGTVFFGEFISALRCEGTLKDFLDTVVTNVESLQVIPSRENPTCVQVPCYATTDDFLLEQKMEKILPPRVKENQDILDTNFEVFRKTILLNSRPEDSYEYQVFKWIIQSLPNSIHPTKVISFPSFATFKGCKKLSSTVTPVVSEDDYNSLSDYSYSDSSVYYDENGTMICYPSCDDIPNKPLSKLLKNKGGYPSIFDVIDELGILYSEREDGHSGQYEGEEPVKALYELFNRGLIESDIPLFYPFYSESKKLIESGYDRFKRITDKLGQIFNELDYFRNTKNSLSHYLDRYLAVRHYDLYKLFEKACDKFMPEWEKIMDEYDDGPLAKQMVYF